MTQLNRSNLGVILRFCSSLTVHLMLRGDFHPFSCPELKEEVGSFFSCEMAKINFINLKKKKKNRDELGLWSFSVIFKKKKMDRCQIM